MKSEVNVFAIERCDRNHIAGSSREVARANGPSEVITFNRRPPPSVSDLIEQASSTYRANDVIEMEPPVTDNFRSS